MEESIRNKVLKSMKTKGRQNWARRRAHLGYCASPNCKTTIHMCVPDERKLRMKPIFLGMSLFKIGYTPEARNLFTYIGRKGKEYLQSIPSHPICEEIVKVYTHKKQLYTEQQRPKGPRGGPILQQASKYLLSTMSEADMNSDLTSLDPETSGDEKPQERIPRKIAIAQQDNVQIVIVQKAAVKKSAARKSKSRIKTKSTRVTCSGAALCQRCSKRK